MKFANFYFQCYLFSFIHEHIDVDYYNLRHVILILIQY